jgi:ATP-dependent protease ClpP protease subunit
VFGKLRPLKIYGVAMSPGRTVGPKTFGTELDDCIVTVHDRNIDIRQFAIYMIGEVMEYDADDNWDNREEPGVEYQMASRLIKNLQILSGLDAKRPILIHMKTNGGDWNEGMAIYDAIRFAPNPIVILNYTHARSMSSIIFQAADRRIMMPHATFMFHEGTMSVSGTWKSVVSAVDFAKGDNEEMLNIYIGRMKERGCYASASKAMIAKTMQGLMNTKEDVYFLAQTTVEWGLADGIFDGNWEGLRASLKRRR